MGIKQPDVTPLSPLKKAFLKLEEMQARLEKAEHGAKEPIAIIGMGCRFPGGSSNPESFWRLLRDGVDAIGEIPADRWNAEAYYTPNPDIPGKTVSKWGGFLENIDLFDPHFFGISPREAVSMDPQQRLLLEVSWEALEEAGQAADGLSGSRTGVFLGICKSDYMSLQLKRNDPSLFDVYYASGNAHSVMSGRLSYVLGLQGPSITIDTACSSSLVAVHLACRSLQQRDCNMALAGGCNVILSPENTISYSRSSMLSPTGRCKTFDASADGFVQGEGCGIVVLKRLADAEAGGDRILAVIRGSAANQDGPSSGLTAPNGPAQVAVIREALANAGVHPSQVSYVDAHGTATSLGDPVEVQALGEALGQGRAGDQPLMIGSVKTNIGHLEAAAGVASLIKTVLCLQKREIPPHLHFRSPNPFIPWENLSITVPTKRMAWAPATGARIAGVSSFGFSGTNVHVILEEPPSPRPATEGPYPCLLTLSAGNEKALTALARRFLRHVEEKPAESVADICYTAGVGRSHFRYRWSALVRSGEELRTKLDTLSAGKAASNDCRQGKVETTDGVKIAFLFTGQGSQYPGMAQALYQTQPIFRKFLHDCDEILHSYLGESLLPVIFAAAPSPAEENSLLDQTGYAQPALFAVEYALAQLWLSWGIKPAAVMGHSVGELVAACLAGVFSLEDGLRLIVERSRLMQALPSRGRMIAVLTDEHSLAEVIAPHGSVSIAAVNGPKNTVISGDERDIEAILAKLKARGVDFRSLRVSHAFHSPLMTPMVEAFGRTAADIRYAKPRISLISNVTGEQAAGLEVCTADYWCRHVLQPVRYQASLKTLYRRGFRIFVEIGPHPVLLGMAADCLPGDDCRLIPSLRKGIGDLEQILSGLGRLYVQGAEIDWKQVYATAPHRRLSLPTYPFQRKRCWIEESGQRRSEAPGKFSPNPARPAPAHPMLDHRLETPLREIIFQCALDSAGLVFLADHVVHGSIVFPATAYVELAMAAAVEVFGREGILLHDLTITEAMILPENDRCSVQVVLTREDTEAAAFQVFSLTEEDEHAWKLHAAGRLRVGADASDPIPCAAESFEVLMERCRQKIDVNAFYDGLHKRGLNFGKTFRGVKELWRRDGEAVGKIGLADQALEGMEAYHMHPALLDACIQVVGAAVPGFDPLDVTSDIFMPIGLETVQIRARAGATLMSHVLFETRKATNTETLTAHVRIFDEQGREAAAIKGLCLKRVRPTSLLRAPHFHFRDWQDWLYQVEWRPQSLEELENSDNPPELQKTGQLSLHDPLKIAKDLGPKMAKLGERHGVAVYDDLNGDLDTLCVGYILEALKQLGWKFPLKSDFTLFSLADDLGVVERHRRLLGRFLQILAEEGILGGHGEEWEVLVSPVTTDVDKRAGELLKKYPDYDVEVNLTRRCGEQLAALLRGELDPLQVLFPGGDLKYTSRIYTDSPVALTYNSVVKDAVAAAVGKLPNNRLIRILEVGAGTGGTTTHVVPALAGRNVEYLFTDIGQAFVVKASQVFSRYPFVKYRVMDIEKNPSAQELGAERYDIVIAANVIHATRDLRGTLGNIHRLMAADGMLILVEVTKPQRWFDLTFGLTEGWWRFDDHDLRPSYPLISPRQWLGLLDECGFEAAPICAEKEQKNIPAKQTVFLAKPSDSRVSADSVSQQGTGKSEETKWLIFSDVENRAAESLAALFRERGEQTTRVSAGEGYRKIDDGHYQVDPTAAETFAVMLKDLLAPKNSSLRGVVHLWGMSDYPQGSCSVGELSEAQNQGCRSVLYLTQALLGLDLDDFRGLWLVTRGAQWTGAEVQPAAVAQAPLWGLGKVIALEHPELGCVRIDMDPKEDSGKVKALFREILNGNEENQIAYRNNRRYVARLARRHRSDRAEESAPAGSGKPVRLEMTTPGVLDGLVLRPTTRSRPGPGEIEIRVRATGLNFRDVLNALGMRDDDNPLGSECAGTVVSVGEGVENFRPGDEVIAVSKSCFSTYAIADKELVVAKPSHLGFEQAAALPLAFLTAYYALHEIGELKSGNRVLIHAAAGGVGMAAVQIAQKAGAEIFATAGSPEKRAYLRSLGVDHVMDSRSLGFADEIMKKTSGRGVDIVLNSLTGEAIPKSLGLLRAKGRFLELGKAEIWEKDRVLEVNPQAEYLAVDLTDKLNHTPAELRPLFLLLMARFEAQIFKPLPLRLFSLDDAAGAFRLMAQAGHIGKIVVVQNEERSTDGTLNGNEAKPLAIEKNGTYFITGGLAGLGLLVAQWLAEKGAGALILMARSAPTATTLNVLADMEKQGTTTVIVQGDVSREADVIRAFAVLQKKSLPPLRGVVHSAGLLDDGALLQQDWERFSRVMAPKVEGAWNLHRATENLSLDFFVLFSSIASLLGAAGEGNHSAANAFLDGLAHHRRAKGLPALSINWGAWRDIGAAERHRVGKRIMGKGIDTFSPEQGLRILENLMMQDTVQVGVMPVQWEKFLAGLKVAENHYLSDLVKENTRRIAPGRQKEKEPDFLERLQNVPLNKRHDILMNCIQDQVLKVLGIESAEDMDPTQALHEAGLDSLMAVELRNLLGNGLRLKRLLPATLVYDYPTITALAGYLEREVLHWETDSLSSAEQDTTGDAGLSLDELELLSDEEVDQLFLKKMTSA
jgi:acyl transferase domain-containing protein